MQNEPTNPTNTPGAEPTTPLAKDGEPISDYDKALKLVERREALNKEDKEILARKEKLAANQMLGGNTGGNVVAKMVSEKDKKAQQAQEFFKDTALGDAIKKTNE
ncbi:hypothetical protein KAR91_65730 [Candidatus Pacearchaeota archaeon]|nr:hypothetical protein [Candidatus Pacearchaeota archaeon]